MALRICATSRRVSPKLAIRVSEKRGYGFTLIEMLVAMAITLVMMGAVVTLFANISGSVSKRRATTEMSGQLRHVRNVLQQDLQGATCPGQTWQKPESNHGYIEITEGPYKEGFATNLLDAVPNGSPVQNWPPTSNNPEIDHAASTLPSSDPKVLPFNDAKWATDGSGLGDSDDILMLTSRNEREPFVGRSPTNVRRNVTTVDGFVDWGYSSIQSPLAEVIWFAVENPGFTEDPPVNDPTANHFFGEPGFRTIYRRALLIAPWLNPYRFTDSAGNVTDTFAYDGGTFKAELGLLRILKRQISTEEAIASMIAFQDRYDISARLEWDANIDNGKGRWKIMANTLGDLTKRENRFGHFFFRPVASDGKPVGREFPFALISTGSGYSGSSANVQFVTDPEITPTPTPSAKAKANLSGGVASYDITIPGNNYKVRPFAYVDEKSAAIATTQVMLNDDGSVVRLTPGPVPLWGSRRGEDVMMTDVLAFDLRVYDPGAPIFATVKKAPTASTSIEYDVVLTPSDPGWRGMAPNGANGAYLDTYNMKSDGSGAIGTNQSQTTSSPAPFYFVGQGAYVDMGYGYDKDFLVDQVHVGPPGSPRFPQPAYASGFASSIAPWFFSPQALSDVYGMPLAPGYAVYDTWSFHYENNGINEDGYWYESSANKWHWYDPLAAPPAWKTKDPAQVWRKIVDQAVDGLDTNGALGIDDVGERETTPAYDKPLRGMQALIRTYEHDSRAIRQVRVNQHFMQE